MTTPRFNKADHPRSVKGDRWIDKPQSPDELGQLQAEPSNEDQLTAIYVASGAYSDEAARATAVMELRRVNMSGVNEDFYLDYLRFKARRPRYTAWPLEMKELHDSGYTAADLEDLMDLGDPFEHYAGHLLQAGVTAERVAELVKVGVPKAVDPLIAMNPASDDMIRGWLPVLRGDPDLKRWASTWYDIGSLVKAGFSPERAADFSRAGIDVRSAVAGDGRFSPTEARAFAIESKLSPEKVGAYMLHNLENEGSITELVSADAAKKFGSSFTPSDVAALSRLQVDPKVARSLHSADRTLTPKTIEKLSSGGVTTAKALKSWRELTGPQYRSQVGSGRRTDHNTFSRENPDSIKRIIAAQKSGVTVDAAASYVAAGVHDPAVWKPLFTAGVTDAKPWAKALSGTGRANQAVRISTDERTVLMAEFAKAGGTPERLGAIQKAGIPITEAHLHLTGDLWAAGAAHRARVLAAETKQFDEGRSLSYSPPAPWEWTEDTYLG